MTSMQGSPGFYGKVPVRGDFVTRRLPVQFVRNWDNWLQSGLSASREKLGEGWLDVYLTSPIWRFALSPGNCGADAWAGILMPSVDKVGRYFPLTVAVAVSRRETLPWLLLEGGNWFDKVETLALTALEDDLELDAFDRELQTLELPPLERTEDGRAGPGDIEDREGGVAFSVEIDGLERIRDGFLHMSASFLSRFVPSYSLWCTSGSERVAPSLTAYAGLPAAGSYVDLLGGGALDGPRLDTPGARITVTRNVFTDMDRGLESAAPPLRFRSNGSSTVGFVRGIEGEVYLQRPETGLWAIADEMGDDAAGDAAAGPVIEALGAIAPAESLQALAGRVRECLEGMNPELFPTAGEHGTDGSKSWGSAILLAAGDLCSSAQCGGCRIYRYREGDFSLFGRDRAADPAIESGTDKDVPPSAPGAGAEPAFQFVTAEVREGDLFLLCTDSLMQALGSGEVASVLSASRFENISTELIELALDRGVEAVVTVVAVRADTG